MVKKNMNEGNKGAEKYQRKNIRTQQNKHQKKKVAHLCQYMSISHI